TRVLVLLVAVMGFGALVVVAGAPSGLARPSAAGWSIQAVPSHSGVLTVVSCPSRRLCIAVGDDANPVAELRNGTRWSIQHPAGAARPGFLDGVSCPSASDCVAVGDAGGSP